MVDSSPDAAVIYYETVGYFVSGVDDPPIIGQAFSYYLVLNIDII